MERKRKGLTLGVNKEGLTDEGLTHPVMKYLIPGEDRKKTEAIAQKLTDHKQLENVYLGCGRNSLPMDVVGDLLEVTR